MKKSFLKNSPLLLTCLFVFFIFTLESPRACLKKAFRELRVPVCGRFYPNKGGVAGYGNRMRVKYTAKWGLQIAEMIFQTRSSISVDSPLINSTLATYQSQCTVRNTNVVWVYKTVNEKKYKRLYNIETGQWIGDWIPA